MTLTVAPDAERIRSTRNFPILVALIAQFERADLEGEFSVEVCRVFGDWRLEFRGHHDGKVVSAGIPLTSAIMGFTAIEWLRGEVLALWIRLGN